MIDALKTLFENDVVSEDVRAQIEEAWEERVKENRQQATAELREEFAQKYEYDKQTMVEAIDTMISERLAEEIQEFKDDRQQLAEAKAKYVQAMRENADLLQGFVVEQLQSELEELRQDKKKMESQHKKLEEFVVESLSKEISEFYEDKRDVTETKVRLIKESKQQMNKLKKSFVKKSARVVSETVEETLKKEIGQLHEDIEVARRNDFGRKIFEAFANEYSSSMLNERSELSRMMKLMSAKDKQLAEARAYAAKAKRLAESAQKEKTKLTESVKRGEIINDLVGPLGRREREIMIDLLETVQTDRLQVQFNKYLPSVVGSSDSQAKRRQPLSESTEMTGDRKKQQTQNSADDSNVVDLRRLAGLN